MKIIKRVAAVLALSLLVASCGSEESEQSGEEWPDKIVFGFVPSQEQEDTGGRCLGVDDARIGDAAR